MDTTKDTRVGTKRVKERQERGTWRNEDTKVDSGKTRLKGLRMRVRSDSQIL